MQLVDSQGLFDMRMPWPLWINNWNTCLEAKADKYERIIWVVRSSEHPSDNVSTVYNLLKTVLGGEENVPQRVIAVMTFCD